VAAPFWALEIKIQDAFPGRLDNVHEPSTAYPFAQQEEQWRLGLYTSAQFLWAQQDAWKLGVCGAQQLDPLSSIEFQPD
jgi:hypothetical protein